MDIFIIVMGIVLGISGLAVAIWSFIDTRRRYPKGYADRSDYNPEA